MTWAEILAEIKRTLKEPPTGGHWTDAELLRRANIGQRMIVRLTGCLTGAETILSVSWQGEYDKPANILKIIRVSYNGKRIYGIPISDLDTTIPNWQENIGIPTNYYETFTKIGLYPKPNATGEPIVVEGVIKPNDLTTGTSVPFNAVNYLEDYHDLITSFVLYRCLLEDGNQLYTEHKNNYYQGIMSLKSELLSRPDELRTFSLLRRRHGRSVKPLPFME